MIMGKYVTDIIELKKYSGIYPKKKKGIVALKYLISFRFGLMTN